MTATTFIRLPAVKARFGFSSDESVWCKLRRHDRRYDPHFPRPVKIGKRAVAWVESEILAYQNTIIAKRDQSGS